MSSDHNLGRPTALVDYDGSVLVVFQADEKEVVRQQGCVDVICPCGMFDVEPLVTLQCVSASGQEVGPKYAYDREREEWVSYDERIHPVPESSAPVDVGAKPRQLDMSASSQVELSAKGAPTLESPSEADDELDEPSEDESPLGPELDLGDELDLDDDEDE